MSAFLKRAWPYLAALAIAVAALYGAYRHGTETENTRWTAKYNADLAAAHEATAKAQADARGKELAAAQRQAKIEADFLQREKDAKTHADSTIADLRAGNLRLRDQFRQAACAVASVPGVAASAGERDAACGGGLSESDVGFLVLFAERAQRIAEQLKAAQQVIIADRLVCGVADHQ